jgi:hypothetical protein
MRRRKRQVVLRDSYELSEEEKDEKDEVNAQFGASNAWNRAMYDPAENQRVPKTGAWAIIMQALPAIEGGVDREVRPGRVFFLEQSDGADAQGFLSNGSYKVVLHSPWGDVWLWPHEYRVLPTATILALWATRDLTFHPTRIDSARMNEITFYARSRGIALADAAVMALGTIEGPIGWFEATAEVEGYVAMIGRMGGPLTAVNHARRAAARTGRKRRASSPADAVVQGQESGWTRDEEH